MGCPQAGSSVTVARDTQVRLSRVCAECRLCIQLGGHPENHTVFGSRQFLTGPGNPPHHNYQNHFMNSENVICQFSLFSFQSITVWENLGGSKTSNCKSVWTDFFGSCAICLSASPIPFSIDFHWDFSGRTAQNCFFFAEVEFVLWQTIFTISSFNETLLQHVRNIQCST